MTVAACRHHWSLETPTGPWTHGQCKLCGSERDFPSWDTDPEAITLGHNPRLPYRPVKPCESCGETHKSRAAQASCRKRLS